MKTIAYLTRHYYGFYVLHHEKPVWENDCGYLYNILLSQLCSSEIKSRFSLKRHLISGGKKVLKVQLDLKVIKCS